MSEMGTLSADARDSARPVKFPAADVNGDEEDHLIQVFLMLLSTYQDIEMIGQMQCL